MNREEFKKVIRARRFFILPFMAALLLAGVTSLRPLGEDLAELFAQEENIASQMMEKEKAAQQMGELGLKLRSSTVSTHSLMRQLQQTALSNRLQLLDLSVEAKTKTNKTGASHESYSLKVRFTGDFLGVIQWLRQVQRQAFPLLFKQVVLTQQENGLLLTLQAVLPSVVMWMGDQSKLAAKEKITTAIRDPFQEVLDASLLLSALQAEPELRTISVKALHYIGHLAQGSKKAALLLLPDGRVKELRLGDLIGKEKCRVLAISPKSLTLKSEQTKQLLTLNRE